MRKALLLGTTLIALAALAAAPPEQPLLGPPVELDRSKWSDPNVLAFSPDGKLLATGGSGIHFAEIEPYVVIHLWDLNTQKLRATWNRTQPDLVALTFSPDGKTVGTLAAGQLPVCWNLATGSTEAKAPPRLPTMLEQLSFSADGLHIWSRDPFGAVAWERSSGKEVYRLSTPDPSSGGALSHDLSLLAAVNDRDVHLWDIRTGKLVRSLPGHPTPPHALSFSGDDRFLAVLCHGKKPYPDPREVCLWDVRLGHRLRTLSTGELCCHCAALSPSGEQLALLLVGDKGWSAQLRLIDPATGQELARSPLPTPTNGCVSWGYLTFSPDGRALAASWSGNLLLWPVRPGSRR